MRQMLQNWIAPIWRDKNARQLKRMDGLVAAINALEARMQAMDDTQLKAQTPALRTRLEKGEALDALLPEAFAVVREAAQRVLGQRHFDVQLQGGIILHRGNIAEMKTGEGKTLVATLPCYLNALSGHGVHVVTVNDYLAQRDAAWMGQIHEFLGLRVGCIISDMTDAQRKDAYNADITYGTNNELGFDYLRDNMKYSTDEMVQRGHKFAIVDEVDSILIDEARTPLIISGPAEEQPHLYTQINTLIPKLDDTHYELDEKSRSVALTEEGNKVMEDLLRQHNLLGVGDSLYEIGQVGLVHYINNALKAHKIFARDKDYIVKDKKVVIIDEFTGRMMAARRYSDGIHQALEAKEAVPIESENQTLAAVTFQNYFRLYDKLAGMTGTAETEADEFLQIYGLDVLVVPTNAPVCRQDDNDMIFRTAEEKYTAITNMIQECQTRAQPVLVGTTSIEKSEMLSARLKKMNIDHQVLNARYHEQEAQIIAQAGQAGAVTIATNMAGRGTDIQLGGNPDMLSDNERAAQADDIAKNKARVIAAGGLCVIGTERHESRRIDNQLRGRSGRQGDPGRSCFFLSLEDDLMRIFGTDRMDGMLKRLGLKDGEAIVHPWITSALERAQKKVEAHNFDMRKNILKFDDVMNEQRKVIFEQRRDIMQNADVQDMITDMRSQVIEDAVAAHIPPKTYMEQWDLPGLQAQMKSMLDKDLPLEDWAREDGVDESILHERISQAGAAHYAKRRTDFGDDTMTQLEKTILLQMLDHHWREHLSTLEQLRQVIGLRGYGQRDPLNEYKLEAFSLFRDLLTRVRQDVTRLVMSVQQQATPAPAPQPDGASSVSLGASILGQTNPALQAADPSWKKTPRNAPCPCRSGRKYKHCHGRL